MKATQNGAANSVRLPLPTRTRIYPSSALNVAEVGYIRLRLGEGGGEGVTDLSRDANPHPEAFAGARWIWSNNLVLDNLVLMRKTVR
jgi:hypothetical protein